MTPFGVDERSTGSLLSDIFGSFARLMRGEIALARAEIELNLRGVFYGCALLLIAVVFATVALHALAGAAIAELVVAGLSPPWAAFAVGGTALVFAVLCAARGTMLLGQAKRAPQRALHNLSRDVETLKQAARTDASS